MTAIASLQPATRREVSQPAGREICRDVIGALKRHGLIDASLRARAWRAARLHHDQRFLQALELGTLRDLPEIARFEDAGTLERTPASNDLDGLWGLGDDEA